MYTRIARSVNPKPRAPRRNTIAGFNVLINQKHHSIHSNSITITIQMKIQMQIQMKVNLMTKIIKIKLKLYKLKIKNNNKNRKKIIQLIRIQLEFK